MAIDGTKYNLPESCDVLNGIVIEADFTPYNTAKEALQKGILSSFQKREQLYTESYVRWCERTVDKITIAYSILAA